MGWFSRNKKPKQLYFAVAIADKPLDEATFAVKEDCKAFIIAGEVEKHDIIPRTVLKEEVERIINPTKTDDGVKISERAEPA